MPTESRGKLRKTQRRHAAVLAGIGCAAVLASAAACRRAVGPVNPPPAPRNLLLITVDTLRADAVGAYGNRTAVTPWLDRLSTGGVRFDHARAHTVVTLPSHASIMTGRLPPDHGVRDNAGFRLAGTEDTLAARLKARGFRTGAFVSAFPLDSRFGLAKGFDVYDDVFIDAAPRPTFIEQERAAPATVAAATRWLQAQTAAAGWFCWVHLYEPHFPYAPPTPFGDRFARDPYAGEVAATDSALGPLLQPILDAGAATDTLVVVTADHGESLGEHGEATHGIFAYEATLRVPLILYYPPLLQARSVATAVGHVDLLPTILDALHIPPAAGLRGRSLLDLARGKPAAEAVTYFEALSGSLNRGWAPLSGILSDGLKYVDLPIPELYDLRADPGEANNLAAARPHEVEKRHALLLSFAGRDIQRTDETADVKERLRALGYVAANTGAARARYTEADDPKRLVDIDTQLQQIVGLYLAGHAREALTRCRALVRSRPTMRVGLLQLAQLERESGNMAAAIAALQQALKVDTGDAETASLLGAYLTSDNRPREAIELLQPYAARADADTQVLVTLSLAQSRDGRFDAARSALERARAQDPSNARLLVTLGTVELMAGRRAQARSAFESALAQNADTARAHSSLGAMAAEEGRHDDALVHWQRATHLDPEEYEKLLAVGISLARTGRAADAVPYLALFAEAAPSPRYARDIAKAQEWLRRERR
jgi:arylsulfatase A-like enzyme/Flp pilus assembly protein TadD